MLSARSDKAFHPERLALLRLLSAEIDDSMVNEIAEADYGYAADKHLAPLRKIRDDCEIPAPLEWEPREVLELIRWSEPDDPTWKPGGVGRRGHLMRAFCCTALLIAGADERNRDWIEGENSTLVQLLDSLSSIGTPFQAAGLSLIAWRLDHIAADEEERPFFLLATLVLALRATNQLDEEIALELSNLVVDHERAIRESDWAVLPEAANRWLLGLTHFDLKHERWERIGDEINAYAQRIQAGEARDKLTEIASRLSEEC
jgi:hypothetical protein